MLETCFHFLNKLNIFSKKKCVWILNKYENKLSKYIKQV